MKRVELAVRASSDRYDEDSDAWFQQESDLRAALAREVGISQPSGQPDPGSDTPTKGIADTVIIALTSAHVVRGLVDCLRAWLNRDRTRSVVIEWEIDGKRTKYTIDSSNIDRVQFAALQEAMRKNLEA